MNTPQNPKRTRRELFISALRLGSLGAIGACAGAALTKRQRLVKQGICIGGGLCCRCDLFDDCGLPRAASAKLAKGQRS
jgi:hypothetical protein